MNAERLHLIARALWHELSQLRIVENLEQLRDSLQQQVNQPQQAGHQQVVSQRLAELYRNLQSAPSDEFSPAWRQILYEMKAEDLLGSRLANRIRDIFERNQITPVTASEEVKKLHQEVSRLQNAVGSVRSAFEALHIPAEELNPGECEVGILVPRSAADNELGEFGAELEELDFIFKVFNELVTGKRDDFKLRTISSSDLSVYVAAAPGVAACIAATVSFLIDSYKSLLEIRKLRGELKEKAWLTVPLKG